MGAAILLGVAAGLLAGRAWSAAAGVAEASLARAAGEPAWDRGGEADPLERSGAAWPRYTEDGALMRPDGFERWPLAGASLGLGYGDAPAASDGPGSFHNVYLEPGAYAAFTRTGAFPQGTMLAMAVYEPEERVPPQRQGYVEGAWTGLEVAVKDSSRFEGGWAYFAFARVDGSSGSTGIGGGGGPGARFATSARPFPPSACATCHREHAALDNVFTQFYPLLREGGKP